jgi:hypothetical protein
MTSAFRVDHSMNARVLQISGSCAALSLIIRTLNSFGSRFTYGVEAHALEALAADPFVLQVHMIVFMRVGCSRLRV